MKKSEINVGAGLVSARKGNKGITLIALIITIIIMLILVAVSIQVALNTGLFDAAGKATQDWETAQDEEKQLAGGQVTIGNKTYGSIEDYVYGEGPKLKYSTYGKLITISLDGSYLDYISEKSIAEKEHEYAVLSWGYESIEDVINNEYEGNRQTYESWIIAANSMYANSVMTYEEALDLDCMANEAFRDEYLATNTEKGNVTVTAQDGTKYELSYTDTEKQSFTHTAEEYGNYKFVASNSEGRTSEITVPVEKTMGTFTIEYGGETLGTFEFELGTTWEEFIGPEGYRVLNERISIDRYVDCEIAGATENGDYPLMYTNDYEWNQEVIQSDLIIINFSYVVMYVGSPA